MSAEISQESVNREAPGASTKSLAGKRILVTRAQHQAARLAEALEVKGAEVVRVPTIAIAPPESYARLDAALRSLESFDWLILTSVNGVEALAERMRLLKISFPSQGRLRIAAIGPATSRAAGNLGLVVNVTPAEYIAEAVAEALRGQVAGKRILLVRAAVGRDVIPSELSRQGAEVHVAEAYQTIIPVASIRTAYGLFGGGKPLPDAVTFTSSSTVKHFLALLRAAGIPRPAALRAISIGPITTRTLRECASWEPAGEATHSDIPGLVEACERVFA